MLRLLCALSVVAVSWPAVAGDVGSDFGRAVSGPNAKLSVEGGSYDGDGAGLALGSFTTPIGNDLGVQFDGALGTVDDEVLGGGGVHVFTRDPSSYLLGAYGSFHTWDDIDIWRVAVEGELYLGRFSLSGIGGYENVDVPGTSGGLSVLTPDDEHFFGKVDLSFYATDNLKLSGGYRYESEVSLGTAGVEYLIAGFETPVSVFGRGDFGESDYSSVTGGLKIYFGGDPRKSLIQRHRTEDPDNYTPVFPKLQTATPSGSNAPAPLPMCPTYEALPNDTNCECPDGTEKVPGSPATVCSPPGTFSCRATPLCAA